MDEKGEFEKRNFWQNKFQNTLNKAKNSAISPPLKNFAHKNTDYAKFSKEEQLARALRAESRRKILRLLSGKELTVSEIAQASASSLSLASRHLTFLFDVGLISVRKEKPYKHYFLKSEATVCLLKDYETIHRHKLFKVNQRGEENLARILNAASRRIALRLLAEKELTVTELANHTQMSISLASRHLKLAHDLGFLKIRKAAPHKYYSLAIEPLKQLIADYDIVLKEL